MTAIVGDPDSTVAAADFRRDGLCAQTDPELFFPEKGEAPRDAKRICEKCPVRIECQEYALQNNELFGIWGGLTPRERRRIRAARREGRAA